MRKNVSKRIGENEFGIRIELQKAAHILVDFFFPRRCPICDEILEPEIAERKIHGNCEKKLYPVVGAVCMKCGRPLENTISEYCHDCSKKSGVADKYYFRNMRYIEKSNVAQGKSLFLYQGAIKQTMYRFKYSNKREYADFFAECAVKKYGKWIKDKQIDVIVPVPMYRKKQRVRGYNQAESFAKALSEQLQRLMLIKIPVDIHLIQRVVDTTPQKELNDIERKNNLKSAFQKSENIVQYKHILVVDDIYTTGSTAEAVAEELIKTGYEQIYFLSICIGKGI